jgi:hypothetical protein
MLEYNLHRESSLVLAAKILVNLFDEETVIETEEFYWNLWGNDEDMPNLWIKNINLQLEWYSDDPGRGAFTNYEEPTADLALDVLRTVKESYDARTETT